MAMGVEEVVILTFLPKSPWLFDSTLAETPSIRLFEKNALSESLLASEMVGGLYDDSSREGLVGCDDLGVGVVIAADNESLILYLFLIDFLFVADTEDV